MTNTIFAGTGVAIATPFRNDGSIDFKSMEKLIEHVISNGINYIVVLGTTGESVTLSKDEKTALVNFVIDVTAERIPIVVGIGGNNTREVISTVKQFDFSGVSGVLSVAPYYNKPSQEGLFEHFRSIASVCPVPVIIYNVPGRTSSNIGAETTLKLARKVDNIVAIKEASGSFSQIMEITKNKPNDFLVISGDDALTLPMLSVGAKGVISVIANAYPAEFSTMVKSALGGDFIKALSLQYKLMDMMKALFEEGSPAGVKAVLNIKKLAPNNLRLPLLPVNDKHYKKLEKLVKALG